jgi:hypothetical protein
VPDFDPRWDEDPRQYDAFWEGTHEEQLFEFWCSDPRTWYNGEWPPRDAHGKMYYYSWIDVRELDADGQLTDRKGRQYSPFAGNIKPIEGACNARLNNWAERYPRPRYCANTVLTDSGYCRIHDNLRPQMNAKEALQHGLAAKTRDHVYNKLDPWKQLMAHGLHEDLLDRSRFEFAQEFTTREFDFSDVEVEPDIREQDGPVFEFDCVYATEHVDRSLTLWAAAMDSVKMLHVNSIITADEMRVKQTSEAQLTAPPSEHDSSPQQFKTIEEWGEHYLNLPYSRLARDRKELLKYGGIVIDGETTTTDNTSPLADRLSKLDDAGTFIEDEPEMIQQGSEMKRQLDLGDDS